MILLAKVECFFDHSSSVENLALIVTLVGLVETENWLTRWCALRSKSVKIARDGFGTSLLKLVKKSLATRLETSFNV